MSFILDALKKSEHERELQAQGRPPEIIYKRRTTAQPWWVLAIVGLLVLNFMFVLVLWLRSDHQQAAPVITVNSGTPATTVVTPAPAQNSPAFAAPSVASSADASATSGVRSLQEEVYPPATEAGDETAATLSRANIANGPQLVRSVGQNNSNNTVTNSGLATAVNDQRNARPVENVPSLDSLGGHSALNLPPLHLDIHVYSAAANERFVFINMRKYLEGQGLNEGPMVDRITPEGAVLSYRGQHFLLPRQ